MDRIRLEQMLDDLRQERSETEQQVAALQVRLDALRKTADGIEELLTSEPTTEPATAPAESADAAGTLSGGAAGGRLPVESPTGSPAAKIILQGTPGQFRTVREVWDEQATRGWVQRTKETRAAVRAALDRLHKRDPNVERITGPTLAYRWISPQGEPGAGAASSRNGSVSPVRVAGQAVSGSDALHYGQGVAGQLFRGEPAAQN